MTKMLTEAFVTVYAAYFVTVLTGMHFVDKVKDKFMSNDEYELRRNGNVWTDTQETYKSSQV
jgi:hypothetical protein